MSYVAAVCGKGAEVNQVKEQLLQSNPVLEGRISCVPRVSVTRTMDLFAELVWWAGSGAEGSGKKASGPDMLSK